MLFQNLTLDHYSAGLSLKFKHHILYIQDVPSMNKLFFLRERESRRAVGEGQRERETES